MSQKIRWKLFWKESSVLVTHTLLAGFYLKISQVLFDYYKLPLLAMLFLIASLFLIIPLFTNFLDLWARSVEAVREDALAEKMLKVSISCPPEVVWQQKRIHGGETRHSCQSVFRHRQNC